MHGGGDYRYETNSSLLKTLEIEIGAQRLEKGEHRCVTRTCTRGHSGARLRGNSSANSHSIPLQIQLCFHRSQQHGGVRKKQVWHCEPSFPFASRV